MDRGVRFRSAIATAIVGLVAATFSSYVGWGGSFYGEMGLPQAVPFSLIGSGVWAPAIPIFIAASSFALVVFFAPRNQDVWFALPPLLTLTWLLHSVVYAFTPWFHVIGREGTLPLVVVAAALPISAIIVGVLAFSTQRPGGRAVLGIVACVLMAAAIPSVMVSYLEIAQPPDTLEPWVSTLSVHNFWALCTAALFVLVGYGCWLAVLGPLPAKAQRTSVST